MWHPLYTLDKAAQYHKPSLVLINYLFRGLNVMNELHTYDMSAISYEPGASKLLVPETFQCNHDQLRTSIIRLLNELRFSFYVQLINETQTLSAVDGVV